MRFKTCPLSGGMCFALSRGSESLEHEYFPYPQLTRRTRTASVTKMIAPNSKKDQHLKKRGHMKNGNFTCKNINNNILVSRNIDKVGKPARANLISRSDNRHKEGRHELLCYQCCSRITSGLHNVETQTSMDAFKSNQPPSLEKISVVAKRDVCLMTNDPPYGRYPDCDLLKPKICFEFSEPITRDSNDLRNIENKYFFGKKLLDKGYICTDGLRGEIHSKGDGLDRSSAGPRRETIAHKQGQLYDQFVNLVLNGESGEYQRKQEVRHFERKNDHPTIGRHSNKKFGELVEKTCPDKLDEELVQALKTGKKELMMRIHKAQGKVTEIRLKLMELSKSINSKASVDDSNEQLVHAVKLDRMLDETIKELGALSEVIPSNDMKSAGGFVTINEQKPTVQKFKVLTGDSSQTKKESAVHRSNRDSPAHSTSTTSTDVSSLSALQNELCSFFASMKIQTDRLIEEAENHHEALLNYGNRRLGASCSSDLSSVISGFA